MKPRRLSLASRIALLTVLAPLVFGLPPAQATASAAADPGAIGHVVERLALIAAKLTQVPCVLNAHWYPV